MGAQPAKVRLSTPLSLTALGLKPGSNLDDTLRALVCSHDALRSLPGAAKTSSQSEGASSEVRQRKAGGAASASDTVDRQSQPLPPTDQLLVLLVPGDGSPEEVLGGTFASTNGKRQLSEFGVAGDSAADENSDAATVLPRLCLAINSSSSGARRCQIFRRLGKCIKSPCRRRRKGPGCCRRFGACCWSLIPGKLRERLNPYCQQLQFYVLCARWALSWLWEDRYSLLQELRNIWVCDLWASNEPPPLNSKKLREEMRPFGYALGAGCLYFLTSVMRQAVWAPGPPMDLTLA